MVGRVVRAGERQTGTAVSKPFAGPLRLANISGDRKTHAQAVRHPCCRNRILKTIQQPYEITDEPNLCVLSGFLFLITQ